MPQNEKNTPAEATPPAMDVATATRVNEQRLTRRAALRKLGFGAGVAAFSLLSIDDLARMVGKRLHQVASDNQLAETVARELKNAGLAAASVPILFPAGPCNPFTIGANCYYDINHGGYPNATACAQAACNRCYPVVIDPNPFKQMYLPNYDNCLQTAKLITNLPVLPVD